GEDRSRRQIDMAAGNLADPELRSLQIAQYPDWPADLLLHRADAGNEHPHVVVAGMAHIDAEDVGAGDEQGLDRFLVRGGRSERREDLGLPVAPHSWFPSMTGTVPEDAG